MTSEQLVERLRGKRMRVHDLGGVGFETDQVCIDAADTITRLQEALAAAETRKKALEEALKPFGRYASQFDGLDDEWFCTPAVQIKHLRAAIRSLSAD